MKVSNFPRHRTSQKPVCFQDIGLAKFETHASCIPFTRKVWNCIWWTIILLSRNYFFSSKQRTKVHSEPELYQLWVPNHQTNIIQVDLIPVLSSWWFISCWCPVLITHLSRKETVYYMSSLINPSGFYGFFIWNSKSCDMPSLPISFCPCIHFSRRVRVIGTLFL